MVRQTGQQRDVLPIGWQEDLGDDAAGAFSVGYYVSPLTALPDLVISSGEACALDDGFAGRDQTRFLVPRRSGIEARHDSVSVRLLSLHRRRDLPSVASLWMAGRSRSDGGIRTRTSSHDWVATSVSPVPNGTTPGEFCAALDLSYGGSGQPPGAVLARAGWFFKADHETAAGARAAEAPLRLVAASAQRRGGWCAKSPA